MASPIPSLKRLSLSPLLLTFALATAGCAEGRGESSEDSLSQEETAPLTVDLDTLGYTEGDLAGAPIRVVEFSDFGCVFCARFHMNDYATLHEEFVLGGEVAWKYMPITIGNFPNGRLAALTAECVGEQGLFPAIRDLLFMQRSEWLELDEASAPSTFRGYGEAVGADMARWDACMAGTEASARIDVSNQVAQELGVQGTPTFIVNGFPVQGAPALENFQEALRGLAAELRAAQPQGN